MTLTVDIRHRQGDFQLDVSFTSERGVTALFGRSGSGKTSVLRIVGGLVRPTEGRITLDGDVLLDTAAQIHTPSHQRRFGYVFQEPRLFPHLTVRQNLLYGRWLAPKAQRSQEPLRIFEMLGLETLLERRTANLSGGEQQRVAIGRALLGSPRLLLMDEPLSALDEARKAEILPYLERLRDELDLPILYVSHSVPEVARLADRVVVLADGCVEGAGSASDMLGSVSQSTGREAGSVLSGIVQSVDVEAGLSTIRLSRDTLLLPRIDLIPGVRLRLHVPAREVLLATVRPQGISALNILEGRIVTIAATGDGAADIGVRCGDDLLQARITEVSVRRLGLVPGMSVFAIVKTVALDGH
ncbi:molybdenum ABC transporter ATP-binding protein [Rhizobium sp. SAFR-030]|uniref:molybdenum ABC transporter ATP-binding protein n=1 Tax=Rhizobium sp. SAFR-030 TaxID=3387277 RepID=UPI003F7D32D8